MEYAARIYRTTAVLWLFLAICAIFGAFSAPVFASCDIHFMVRSGLETGFFRIEKLPAMNVAELKALRDRYASVRTELEAIPNPARSEMNEIELKNVKQYIITCDRQIDRANGKLISDPATHAHPKVLQVKVGGKSWAQVRDEIQAQLQTLSLPTERQLLRYFASVREDLVRETGNDRNGSSFDHDLGWDKFDQEFILRERGLPPEAGIFADLFKHWFALSAGLPMSFENEFMHGGRSIAVYDVSAMEELDVYASDLYIFRNQSERTRAVVAIVRPVR